MATDDENLKTLVSVNIEAEGVAIVAALANAGIQARVVGGYTAGFRAEAPGLISVIVAESDLPEAQQILAELKREPPDIDNEALSAGSPEDA